MSKDVRLPHGVIIKNNVTTKSGNFNYIISLFKEKVTTVYDRGVPRCALKRGRYLLLHN